MTSSANGRLWVFFMVISGMAMSCVTGSMLDPFAPSEQQLRVASMMRGNFSNEEQVENQTNTPILAIMFFPMRSNPLNPDVHFYSERIFNRQIVTRHVVGLREDDNGGIRFRVYNLTLSLPDRPLSEVEILQLQNNAFNFLERHGDECDAIFHHIENGTYYGTWPACQAFSPQGMIVAPFLIRCDGLLAQYPPGIPGDGPIPDLFKTKVRFPLLIHSYEHLYYDYCSGDNSCSENY